jgi:ATP-dependent Lhr-like helicase
MALQNGGAIPDLFSYPVIAEPEEKQVGTLDEDFAIESMPGDIFVLGSTSWLIRRVFNGQVRVENARGQAPTVPFWRGEAPARTLELSQEVARLREDIASRPDAQAWLEQGLGLSPPVADLLTRYIRAGAGALTAAPTQATVVAERFFDEAGGMQLILHAPFGARINRAWGMALRKSFCRAFDFELQAAASDDGILLSLGEQHSFPLLDIFDFVSPASARRVLTQAVLQAPVFGTRFRWAAGRSLALSRLQNGKRVPPPLQRARAEDLIAAVFPEQVGCQDNHGGQELEPPDHPLVNETLKDCLTDFMDLEGLEAVLGGLKDGRIRKVAVDLPEPSVFAHQMLNSAPYTFLDDAPLEERRARAVSVRRSLPPADAASFGALDQSAIDQVVAEAAPELRDAEELHDALLLQGLMPIQGLPPEQVEALRRARRAAVVEAGGRALLVAAERVPLALALFPQALLALAPLPGDGPLEREVAARQVVQGWLAVLGPTTARELQALLGLTAYDVEAALLKVESVGQVLRGRFRPGAAADETEWCDRRLLQRIHRLTVGRLRREIEPLSAQDFMRFLFRWHHVDAESKLRGPGGVAKVVALLQGFEAPAAAWEQSLLPARMAQYVGEWLEHACFSGEVAWGRLSMKDPPPVAGPRRGLAVTPGVDGVGAAVGGVAADSAAVAAPAVEPPTAFAAWSARRVDVGRTRSAGLPPGPRLPSGGPWGGTPEAPRRLPTVTRAASLTFARRADLDWMLEAARPGARLADGARPWPEDLSAPARAVLEVLERRGASFFGELQAGSRLLPAQVEDALWELLARGHVTADAVQNLRVLQSPRLRRQQRAGQRGGPGRWSLLLSRGEPEAALEERLAMLFLGRYGIVFRDLLVREPLAPPWRELLPVYRRLEARGELRGGRFLGGFAGEQFALPEAVDLSRAVRRRPANGEVVRVAAVDPLNLTGVVTPGPRVPSVLGQEVVYVDGVPRPPVVAAAAALEG